MGFVQLEKISKRYGPAGAPVIADIDLEIAEGEFVCLMGPSGSGKSTLLTVLGAMNRPSSGRVVIDGIDVYDLSEERRADFRREYLGFVFQQHHLMPHLTALENVMLPLAAAAIAARDKRHRAAAILERVGLGNKFGRLPSQLSGGEQGRVAIARALVNQPPLILADEPTGTLDTRTGAEIMRMFLELNAQGQTILMVTHNPENAAMSNRLLEIRDGRMADPEMQSAVAPAIVQSDWGDRVRPHRAG